MNLCKRNNQDRVNPFVFIASLRIGQPKLTDSDVRNINSNIKVMTTNFEYFRNKYNEVWDRDLIFIFRYVTEDYFQIGNVESGEMQLLCVTLDNRKGYVNDKFDDFKRAFEFLIRNNEPNDCIKLLNLIRSTIIDYNVILKGHNYDFMKSFYYQTFNKCYDIFGIRIQCRTSSQIINARTNKRHFRAKAR